MIKEALEFIANLRQPLRFEAENGIELLLDQSGKIHDITAIAAKYEWAPTRASGTTRFTDPESFVAYVNHFARYPEFPPPIADDAVITPIAMDRKHPALQIAGNHSDAGLSFVAIFNYHQPPRIDEPDEHLITSGVAINQSITPGWCDFRATLDLAKHHEWNMWLAKDRKPMSPDEFAAFIEENETHFRTPNGADMLTLATKLEVNSSAEWMAPGQSRDGKVLLRYEEAVGERVNGMEFSFPQKISIRLPIYIGCPEADVKCRLRYRLERGTIKFWYEIIGAHRLPEAVFALVRKQIAIDTGVMPLLGVLA